ncbi:MAG TPA: hypothetical protein VMQ86_23530 [Bryobacteraceae bacterium]|jgi:hypothetical protein|nr:hypothetical protein [Bryobacteraceae bacterium]
MTDTQLYLAIGLPLLFNGAMLTLLNSNINARFARLEAQFDILTGKFAELTDRVTRLVERMEHR